MFLSYMSTCLWSGPKELGEYLLKLDKDDELYNEYFQVGVSKTFPSAILRKKIWCNWLDCLKSGENVRIPPSSLSYAFLVFLCGKSWGLQKTKKQIEERNLDIVAHWWAFLYVIYFNLNFWSISETMIMIIISVEGHWGIYKHKVLVPSMRASPRW